MYAARKFFVNLHVMKSTHKILYLHILSIAFFYYLCLVLNHGPVTSCD